MILNSESDKESDAMDGVFGHFVLIRDDVD
jgi:hypothetical protein